MVNVSGANAAAMRQGTDYMLREDAAMSDALSVAAALDGDTLPTVVATSLAHWRRDGESCHLTFVELRPHTSDVSKPRIIPVARLCLPLVNIPNLIAVLQDLEAKVTLARVEASSKKVN